MSLHPKHLIRYGLAVLSAATAVGCSSDGTGTDMGEIALALNPTSAPFCGNVFGTGGNVWCLGSNVNGQFGNGSIGGFFATPEPAASGRQLTGIVVGQSSTCGKDNSTDLVYCWGWGVDGQLGIAGVVPFSLTPLRVF